MSRRGRHPIRLVVSSALVVGVILTSWAKSPTTWAKSPTSRVKPPIPARSLDETRAIVPEVISIESMAEEILERRDAVAAIENRLDGADEAMEAAMITHRDAKANAEAARESLKLYKDETYPVARANAASTLQRAELNQKITHERHVWAQDMLRMGYFSEERTGREGEVAKQAKTEAETARKTLDMIEKTLYPKDILELEAAIASADKQVTSKAAAWEKARLVRTEAKLRADEMALTPAESRAIVRLDDAMKLNGSGDSPPARAVLDEVVVLWRGEASHRAAIRSASLVRRVSSAADEIRSKGASRIGVAQKPK